MFCVGVVQTLRDFQYVDRDGRDQGANVREKARQLVCLLRDEERLRQERSQALKTKERMAGGGSGGGGAVYGGIPPSYHPGRRTSQPSMAVLYGEEFSRSRGSPSSFNCEYSGFCGYFGNHNTGMSLAIKQQTVINIHIYRAMLHLIWCPASGHVMNVSPVFAHPLALFQVPAHYRNYRIYF